MNELEKKVSEYLKKRKSKSKIKSSSSHSKKTKSSSSDSKKSKSSSSSSKKKKLSSSDKSKEKPAKLDAEGNPIKKKKKRKFKNKFQYLEYKEKKALKKVKNKIKEEKIREKNQRKGLKPKSEEELVRGSKIPPGYDEFEIQQYEKPQTELFQRAFENVGPESITSRLAKGDQSYFSEMEAPALKQFNDIQAGIANRFSAGGGGPGARSSRNSSGHMNAQNAAAKDFASQLQANRVGLQRQAGKDFMEYTNDLLNKRPFEKGLVQKPAPRQKQEESNSFWGLAGAGIGAAGAGYFGLDPLEGAKVGYSVTAPFDKR